MKPTYDHTDCDVAMMQPEVVRLVPRPPQSAHAILLQTYTDFAKRRAA